MSRIINVFIFVLILFSCSDEGHYEFPQSPYLSFHSIGFIEGGQGSYDTLSIKLNLADKEGDIGLTSSDSEPPYHEFDVIVDNNDQIVNFSGVDFEAPFFIATPLDQKYHYADIDKRPSEYSCADYRILYLSPDRKSYLDLSETAIAETNGFKLDTVFIRKNPYQHNLIIKFFKRINGVAEIEEEKVDWNDLQGFDECLFDVNGRIPDIQLAMFSNLDEFPFRIRRQSRYSYEIEYLIVGDISEKVLLKDTFRIGAQVIDRELHSSNVIETLYTTLKSSKTN